jgi:glycine C-acetyltransferase
MRNFSTFLKTIENELNSIREAGTWKNERIICSAQETEITVGGAKVLNFCANNYLGLSNDSRILSAAKRAIDERGFGLSSVRFICGTQDIHKQLEKAIADFHGMEDAILYPSCFDANAGIFEQISTAEDAVISDALNHASIIDGIRLCKAQRYRYQHLDTNDLERILQETSTTARNRLIVTDGVFSMDGDIAPLKKIVSLAEKYNAQIFVDDCHATGFFGATGRGSPEYCGVNGKIDIINSTLGKALGGATGGYTVGPKPVIDLLRQRSRPYLFSNSIPPSIAGASLETFKILATSTDLVTKVQNNTRHFRTAMKAAGFTIAGADEHAICPVMLGDARLASQFADEMLKRNIYVIGFSFPVVPKGQARIRVQMSAAHTSEQVQRAVDAFIAVGKQLKVIN